LECFFFLLFFSPIFKRFSRFSPSASNDVYQLLFDWCRVTSPPLLKPHTPPQPPKNPQTQPHQTHTTCPFSAHGGPWSHFFFLTVVFVQPLVPLLVPLFPACTVTHDQRFTCFSLFLSANGRIFPQPFGFLATADILFLHNCAPCNVGCFRIVSFPLFFSEM